MCSHLEKLEFNVHRLVVAHGGAMIEAHLWYKIGQEL